MTTIITRIYEDSATAQSAVAALGDAGVLDRDIDIIDGTGDPMAAMSEARVPPEAAEAYADFIGKGHPLVVVRAPIMPLGLARKAMSIADAYDPVDCGVKNENAYVREEVRTDFYNSIMPDHPLFLTSKNRQKSTTVSGALGFTVLSDPGERDSASAGGGHMSTRFLPFGLLKTGERRPSVMQGGPHIMPFPLLSRGERRSSVRRGGGTPFSEIFGLPLLSRR